jgi:thiamine biosynthesis lipoprotein
MHPQGNVAATTERPTNQAGEHTPAARQIVSRVERLMATEVSAQIAVAHGSGAEARMALENCFAWFAEVERRLSRFDPASELCALNRGAGDWFAASETLFAAVFVAIHAASASGGLFNPTLLRRIEALGYDRDFALLAQRSGAAPAAPEPAAATLTEADAWQGVLFDSARRRIWLPAGVALDLGGIAKGWAADVAMERYCQAFAGALINVGGDLRLRGGPQPGQPWSVGIRDPREPAESHATHATSAAPSAADEAWNRATLRFSRGALATSGAARRWWIKDGARRHHLLDPRTGQPLPLWTGDHAESHAEAGAAEPLIATVTALAPTGTQAEMAAKVALARGERLALAEVARAWSRWGAVGPREACDAGVALIFTLSDGRIVHSAHLADWLATWGTDDTPLPTLLNTQGARPLTLRPQTVDLTTLHTPHTARTRA